ncbi:ATP-dependent helicase [Paenibacillus filicis]|uniref:DNA 3'-5' helicase n=1 Tax=Paenibacillus filicis TaxID=669464 RepID=A0ABU9DL02_9BACL
MEENLAQASSGERFFCRKSAEVGVTLNKVQQQAVLQTEGPLLLLASPGSGKTTTVIMRIGYLLEEKGVAPSRIKAVTFSRASATDMKERFARFFPGLPPVDFSTIHSLAFEVVRDYMWRTGTPYRIIEGELRPDEEQELAGQEQPPLHKKMILRHLFGNIVGGTITEEQMDDLTTYISLIKNKLIRQEEWATVPCEVREAHSILRAYETFKRSGADKLLLDYDDMLTVAHQALETEPFLLAKYQCRYDYVLTDESQDTSAVQHAIIEKLVRKHRNLCVVADDDQSIYSWRGADPSYLLQFGNAYPGAKTLFMEQNYRSTRHIVDTANRFIKRNQNRYDKNMFTHNPEGHEVTIRSLSSYAFQASYLVRAITGEEELREIAILYRNNSSAIGLMNAFDRAGIPFYMKDADLRFFSHWVVEDVLNFMRMSYTDKRPDLLEKIHMKLAGYITKQQIAALKMIGNGESVFDNLTAHVELKDYQHKLLEEAKTTFRELNTMPPREAIRTIRGKLGYEKAIDRMCERLGFRKEYLMGILNTLEEIAEPLDTLEDFAKRLKHLETVLRQSRARKSHNAVTCSTFHSSKGLEFKRVYMIDLIDGIIPSSDDKDKKGEAGSAAMEEAVRLFYVGMTRARTELELITYRERDGAKVTESAFVTGVRRIVNPDAEDEEGKAQPGAVTRSGASGGPRGVKPGAASRKRSLDDPGASNRKRSMAGSGSIGSAVSVKVVKPVAVRSPDAIAESAALRAGVKVKHRKFGQGEIMQTDGDRVRIRFDEGEKTLSVRTCLEMGILELEKK